MYLKKKYFFLSLLIFSTFLTSNIVFVHPSESSEPYRVDISSALVIENNSFSLSRGEITELNISFSETTNFTLIIEINPENGRLWGVFFENRTEYYSAKLQDNYKNFLKIVDHLESYLVMHFTVLPGDYVFAFHNSHAHEEPDVTFNFLLIEDFVGIETQIVGSHTHSTTTTEDTSLTGFNGLILILGMALLRLITNRKGINK